MTSITRGLAVSLIGLAASVPAQDLYTLDSTPSPVESWSTRSSPSDTANFRSLDEEIRAIKNEVLGLTANLVDLEEALLFPANSQVSFFVSMDVGDYFDLNSVNLLIDGKPVASYQYSEREVGALFRGGVQRLHIENMSVGEHEIVVQLAGQSEQLKNYQRDAIVDIDKGTGATYVELEITDRVSRQQPEFVVKQWE